MAKRLPNYRIVEVWDCPSSVLTILRHYKLQRKIGCWWFTVKIVATSDHAFRWVHWKLKKRNIKSKQSILPVERLLNGE